MTFLAAYALAARHGLQREFAHAYRWIKPWYAFWISEAEAVQMALAEWDLPHDSIQNESVKSPSDPL